MQATNAEEKEVEMRCLENKSARLSRAGQTVIDEVKNFSGCYILYSAASV
jgi:hypothetical protein